jgi:hypothetical protein
VRAELAREGLVTGAGLAHLPVDRKLSIIHIIVDHLDDMPPPLNTLRDRSGDPRAPGVETALRIHR